MGPIIGIGELLWDVYPDGRKVAGGAPFNFAFHCHQLGHEAVIVSRVGNDDWGKELRDEIKQFGMSDEYIQIDDVHPTGTVKVQVDTSGQPTFEIAENVAWDHLEWWHNTASIRKTMGVCCYGTLASRWRNSRKFIEKFVDTQDLNGESKLKVWDINARAPFFKRQDFRSNHDFKSDWLKLNTDELSQFVSFDPRGDIAGTIRNALPNPVVIVTRGIHGCLIVERNGEGIEIPACPARVVDTVGAGDAFTAAMVVMHLEGRPLRECARFANHYAARVCEHRGATPKIDRREVELAAFGKSD
jgi:fructokinase